jgi:hypothetical protein
VAVGSDHRHKLLYWRIVSQPSSIFLSLSCAHPPFPLETAFHSSPTSSCLTSRTPSFSQSASLASCSSSLESSSRLAQAGKQISGDCFMVPFQPSLSVQLLLVAPGPSFVLWRGAAAWAYEPFWHWHRSQTSRYNSMTFLIAI